jgi:hypothetical protein
MIAGQLGLAQLGLAQLGSFRQLDTPATGPAPVVTIGLYDTSNLNYVTLPDYFRMMGICVY